MAQYGSSASSASAWVSGFAGALFGVLVGYVVAVEQARPAPGLAAVAAPPAAPAAAPASTPALNESELQAYRDILARDPKNVRAAIELGNRLYDAGQYAEAVTYYQQAWSIDPTNVGVSTDLATALWYLGRPDDAIQQFERSLALDPGHAQTLFNLGIVRRDGKQDLKGAVEAWERLRALSPSSAEAQRAGALIEQARQRMASLEPAAVR
jgi:Flp pilus assembly protein TadD